MIIRLKNKQSLIVGDFVFKCSIGKKDLTKNKIEGDKKTPIGTFSLGSLFYRKDKVSDPITKINTVSIKKNMGWCDDPNNKKYNKLVMISKKIKCEKMFRKDNKYDLLIPIEYNTKKIIKNKGSAIFIHLTKDFKGTLGCIAIKKNDFLILLKLLDKKTKIKIN